MGLELTLPPLIVLMTLAVLHRFRVLNWLSFLRLSRSNRLRDLVMAWRAHRTSDAVRANRPPAAPRLEQPSYRGRHRYRGPLVIARGVESPTVPFIPISHGKSPHRPRRPFRLTAKSPSGACNVRRNPVRPGSKHSTAA